jgi:hypothetical protein
MAQLVPFRTAEQASPSFDDPRFGVSASNLELAVRVEFARDSSKLADSQIVGQLVDFVALKGVGRVLITVRL